MRATDDWPVSRFLGEISLLCITAWIQLGVALLCVGVNLLFLFFVPDARSSEGQKKM